MTPSSSRRGVSAAEFMIATVILIAAIIPLYLMFQQTGDAGWRSEIAYKAMQVAREELEEIRLMPIFPRPGLPPEAVYQGHEWQSVAGKNLFARYADPAATAQGQPPRGGLDGRLSAPIFQYPESYRGIETWVKVIPAPIGGVPEDHPDARATRIVRLEVRWARAGVAAEAGSSGTQVYHTVVIDRGGLR